jgi:hypothetical protein
MANRSLPSVLTKEARLAIQIASILASQRVYNSVQEMEEAMVNKYSQSILIMPRLDNSKNILQPGVWIGPAQVVLEDKTMVESALREEPTTSWKKGWSEQAYDFPNTYVTLPVRVMSWDPGSTFSDNQNTRFVQRYYSDTKTFNR